MARFVQRKCPVHSPEEITSCKLLGSKSNGTIYQLKCEACGYEFEDKGPESRHLGQFKYPHYCASTDQTFSTRSEEKAFAKKHSLEVV